jgi:hypothetical protein
LPDLREVIIKTFPSRPTAAADKTVNPGIFKQTFAPEKRAVTSGCEKEKIERKREFTQDPCPSTL